MANFESQQATLGQFIITRLGGRVSLTQHWITSILSFRKTELVTPLQAIVAAVLGAVSGIGIIAIINYAAAIESHELYDYKLPFLFLLMIVAFSYTQSLLLKSCTSSVESALESHRIETAEKLLFVGLEDLETIPSHEIQAGLSQYYEVINTNIIALISGIKGAMFSVLIISYLAFISWQAALLSCITAAICTYVYRQGAEGLYDAKAESSKAEAELLGNINDILGGFKELKLKYRKRLLLLEDLSSTIARASKARDRSTVALVDLMVFGNIVTYLLAGSIIFLLPLTSDHSTQDISRIMALVLFLIGPIGSAIDAAQQFTSVRFSIKQLYRFDDRLNKYILHREATDELPSFSSLDVDNLTFVRPASIDDPGFKVGPLSLNIRTHQITFIEGGNGSGKTTLVRLLTGLYQATSGTFIVNGTPVEPGEYHRYAMYFGAIFSDNHVFRKPYGLSPEQMEVFRKNIGLLGIEHCIPEDIERDLQSEKLSTGQKKRLALALTLAEDCPILVFDEWAADQDPHFREIFYRRIIPSLKADGKAVIAITHDDRYFDLADQQYHMEYGSLRQVKASN